MEHRRTIRLDREGDGRIVIVTLNRPEVHNAISRELAADLYAACLELSGQDHVRVVIVSGAGDRAFSAGADLKERRALASHEKTEHTTAIESAIESLAALPMPTIAAIRGYALAGGGELAIACDLRIASEDATFGFPEVKIGIFPGAGGALRLPGIVGESAARDLLFTGRRIDATDAYRIGLIDRLVAPHEVMTTARVVATSIAENAPLAVRAVKRALRDSKGIPNDRARSVVNALRASLDDTTDYAEGLAAFAERRPPQFTGR